MTKQTKMTEAEAMKAAEELLKVFGEISRECYEREQHEVVAFDIETGKVVK